MAGHVCLFLACGRMSFAGNGRGHKENLCRLHLCTVVTDVLPLSHTPLEKLVCFPSSSSLPCSSIIHSSFRSSDACASHKGWLCNLEKPLTSPSIPYAVTWDILGHM